MHNVRDIRSFSGTKWKKNLGEARAEDWTVYPLLCVPSVTQLCESATWSERSGEVIFLSLLFFCREIFSTPNFTLLIFLEIHHKKPLVLDDIYLPCIISRIVFYRYLDSQNIRNIFLFFQYTQILQRFSS